MKKTVAFLVAVFLSGLMFFVIAQNNKSSKTVWNYEVPRAPYGYDKGSLILTKEDNTVSGEVEVRPNYKVKMRDVSLKNDTLKGAVYIDNEYVSLLGNVTDSVITGHVDTSMGRLNFTAKKADGS